MSAQEARRRMVDLQLGQRGISDARVLSAFREVPREAFLPENHHYFHAAPPDQFDELVWFDSTRAVEALRAGALPSADFPETYPFGL